MGGVAGLPSPLGSATVTQRWNRVTGQRDTQVSNLGLGRVMGQSPDPAF